MFGNKFLEILIGGFGHIEPVSFEKIAEGFIEAGLSCNLDCIVSLVEGLKIVNPVCMVKESISDRYFLVISFVVKIVTITPSLFACKEEPVCIVDSQIGAGKFKNVRIFEPSGKALEFPVRLPYFIPVESFFSESVDYLTENVITFCKGISQIMGRLIFALSVFRKRKPQIIA